MISSLFVMLFLVAMVIFIVYHFYIDYSNWSNTGNTFAEGMTGNVCMTEDSCKKVAESLGLKIGGGGYAFSGSYSTKGLYAYNSGNYSGMAFFGKGGTEAQMKQPINHPKYRPTPPPVTTAPAAPAAPAAPPSKDLNNDQVLSRTTNSRSGINNPMKRDVSGNCKPGCIAPTGPFANCKNITQEGQPKKSCPYTCFNPSLEPNKCQYEQDCNACGIKIFNPDDEPYMDPKQPNMVSEQPYMDPKQPSFAGQQADIPNGSPQATTFQAGQVNTPVPSNNPSGGTKTDGTQSLATQSGNNTLFNEKIMTTVLGNKNLIPSDINITLDKQSNFIRIAKGFMQDLSNIRNVALPNIDNNDFELLGRVIAKIKIQENEQITGPQNDVMKKQLISSVNNILAGTTISNSQVDWESPRTTAKMSTTGMYNDNSNSMLGYGDKATKHHSEKPQNGLCLWKGCEKNEKGKPYDSVYSLY